VPHGLACHRAVSVTRAFYQKSMLKNQKAATTIACRKTRDSLQARGVRYQRQHSGQVANTIDEARFVLMLHSLLM
jgi:hypothetical protein